MNTLLLTELFGGAGRYKALRCLFENADRSFGTRELASAADVDPGNASRWLRRWAELGLLDCHTERGKAVYKASLDPSLVPLRLLLQQDSEMARLLRARLDEFEEDVEAAAIFGSAARGELRAESDIDLLLIGAELSRLNAQAHFKTVGRALGRPVNVQVFTQQAWESAAGSHDHFVGDILANPLVVLKGSSAMLRKP